MTTTMRSLRRYTRIGRYAVEDVMGALADLGYGMRDALRRFWRRRAQVTRDR